MARRWGLLIINNGARSPSKRTRCRVSATFVVLTRRRTNETQSQVLLACFDGEGPFQHVLAMERSELQELGAVTLTTLTNQMKSWSL